jgi:serine/threonine protein kinase
LDPIAGQQLGPYEIVARIGAGGMGEVWRARDTRLKRDVAVKFLAPHLAENESLRKRLALEGTSIAQLAHPNICRIYDVGENYLVMEILEGKTLAERLMRGAMPVAEAMRYGAELASGLAYAHERGIIHRDLKPGNVMITSQGAKLLDFGLATTMEGLPFAGDAVTAPIEPLTQEGAVVGTFQYMAPEQMEGRDVDARSDIFSLGVILFEMLTGTHPFMRGTRHATAAAVLSEALPSLRRLRSDVHPLLEAIVMRCLARDPEQRWQSAADLAETLRLVAGGSLQASEERPSSRRRWIAAIALGAVMVASIVFLVTKLRPVDPADVVREGPPLVMLVDSTAPERVYSSVSRANGASNADDLTDVLRDLPVTLVKENTNALWSREDQVLKERPALIISHRSAFAAPEAGITGKDREELFALADRRVQSFIGYVGLGSRATRFIVYSRHWENVGGEQRWVSSVVARYPHLRGRVSTIHVTGTSEPSFRDDRSAAQVRAAVIGALGLKVK